MSNGGLAHGHTCNDRGGKQAGSSRSACLSIPSDPGLVYRTGLICVYRTIVSCVIEGSLATPPLPIYSHTPSLSPEMTTKDVP